jgi:ketosteroid isomerase-like protein
MTLQMQGPGFADRELEGFVTRCMEGLSHQVRGDSPPFQAVWSHADDVTILGAIGSYARGWADVSTHLFGASRSLDWSDLSVERLVAIASGDLAVTVVLEHMTREVDGESSARTLRTTQAYRREAGEWRLLLRQANLLTPEDAARERALLTEERARAS